MLYLGDMMAQVAVLAEPLDRATPSWDLFNRVELEWVMRIGMGLGRLCGRTEGKPPNLLDRFELTTLSWEVESLNQLSVLEYKMRFPAADILWAYTGIRSGTCAPAGASRRRSGNKAQQD